LQNLEEAVDRVLGGDSAAFGQIVEATSGRLVRMSARMLGNVADAEDVVQDAYVKAYRALTSGQFDRRSRIETWLTRIVVNATLDAKRSHARSRLTAASDVLEEMAGFDGVETQDARLALRELSEWVAGLPEEQQTVVWLKSVEGMESAEIAAVLGCSEGAIEQRLVRARQGLRDKRRAS
jgi:RNA polymerase sigma-70 factor (ECF subfamily)